MKRTFVLLLCCLLLAGCTVRQAPPEAPEAPPAEVSTPAPTPEPTIEPTPEPTPEPTIEPTPEVIAQELAFSLGSSLYQPGETAALSNPQFYSPLVLRSEESFTRLYLCWAEPPVPYTVGTDAFSLSCGEKAYLHELITLPEPCTSVTLTFDPKVFHSNLTDISLFSEGALPSSVQDWQPPCEKADLLVLSTHNDDDILFFGGAEPYYAAERGLAVQVVYFTDQMKLHPRMNDCLNALWYMGIRHYPVMGIFDDFKGDLESYPLRIPRDAGKAFLAENIRRFRPEVLLTQDVSGEYGHMEHVYMLSLFREVIEETADAEKYPESAALYGVWDVPKTYIHLWGDAETQTVMDWDAPLKSFDGLSGFDVARNAYMLHTTEYAKALHLVEGRDDPYSSYRFGLYRSLVGEDEAKNDLFEHLSID